MAEYKPPELGTGQLARYIDHTLLKLDATTEQIDQLCDEAKEHNFKVSGIHLQAHSYLSTSTSWSCSTVYPALTAEASYAHMYDGSFQSVCVRLRHVPQAVERLRGSDVIVACVVDFHQGSSPTAQKLK
jgi:deoxyribose-phosphate aldolase